MRYTYRILQSLEEIEPGVWNACAFQTTADPIPQPYPNPFLSHEFLSALEKSQSAVAETGWLSQHLILEDELGSLVGMVPMYLKSHSMGEYVFDFAWADAFEQTGERYYPKLQVSIPFTPVTGSRFLVQSKTQQAEIEKILWQACLERMNRHRISSFHATFLDFEQWQRLGALGFLLRVDRQFHWQNHNYTDFDDFLADLSSKRRRNILRERRLALQSGVVIEQLTGDKIKEEHWQVFFQFYLHTGNQKWGTPYLTRQFFSLIGDQMADQVLLVLCKKAGKYIAGALNFIGNQRLYGRYWGSLEEHPCLHFEVCYYQAIEYAIQHKLSVVEAGAQGEHKLLRGYLPQQIYSAHWFSNPSFRQLIARALQREQRLINEEMMALSQHSPYRQR